MNRETPRKFATTPGTRDVLPPESTRLLEVQAAIRDRFRLFGFREVVTPVLEYSEVIEEHGLRDASYKLFDQDNQMVLLRPEMTTPIARLVAQRLAGTPPPHKLSYVLPAYRRASIGRGQSAELYQAGVEVVGSASPREDAATIALLVDVLQSLGLEGPSDFAVVLGQSAFYSGYLRHVAPDAATTVTAALAAKDLVAVDAVAQRLPADAAAGVRGIPRLVGPATDESLLERAGCFGVGEQYNLAPILFERARASGLVDIRLGVEVTEAGQDGDATRVRASANGEPVEFQGGYLIGADGAHSVVRRSLGFPLEGFTYEHSTTLITTPFRFEEHIPELVGANYTWTWLDAGSMFRLRDEWRCTFYPRPGEPDVELTDDVIESRMQGILARPEPYEVREKRTYRIHQRIVPDYRQGRIVLAGDAAHVTPPTGGLGMNGGIHDAMNLADKLARVVKGESDSLLDLYTRQRRPVAQAEILAQSHQNRIRMQLWDAEQRKEVMAHMRGLAADPERSKEMLLRTSMIEGLRRAAAVQ